MKESSRHHQCLKGRPPLHIQSQIFNAPSLYQKKRVSTIALESFRDFLPLRHNLRVTLKLCLLKTCTTQKTHLILIRVAGLQLLLDDVSENISDRQLSEKQKEDLSSLTGACRDVLKELEAMVQKYGILATENSTFGGRIRKSSKKLGWDQDGVRDLRSRITSNTTLLNAFNSGLARLVPILKCPF